MRPMQQNAPLQGQNCTRVGKRLQPSCSSSYMVFACGTAGLELAVIAHEHATDHAHLFTNCPAD